jgi:hypothetical protein
VRDQDAVEERVDGVDARARRFPGQPCGEEAPAVPAALVLACGAAVVEEAGGEVGTQREDARVVAGQDGMDWLVVSLVFRSAFARALSLAFALAFGLAWGGVRRDGAPSGGDIAVDGAGFLFLGAPGGIMGGKGGAGIFSFAFHNFALAFLDVVGGA